MKYFRDKKKTFPHSLGNLFYPLSRQKKISLLRKPMSVRIDFNVYVHIFYKFDMYVSS